MDASLISASAGLIGVMVGAAISGVVQWKISAKQAAFSAKESRDHFRRAQVVLLQDALSRVTRISAELGQSSVVRRQFVGRFALLTQTQKRADLFDAQMRALTVASRLRDKGVDESLQSMADVFQSFLEVETIDEMTRAMEIYGPLLKGVNDHLRAILDETD
jgi:hypothetical protein